MTMRLIDNLLSSLEVKEEDNESLQCNIQYANNVGRRFRIEMPTKENPAGSFDMSMTGKLTKVKNGRKFNHLNFDNNGFELIEQKTTLKTKDFYTNKDEMIQKVYYKELEDTIAKVTGAECVKCMHHVVRCRDPPKYATIKADQPAHAAHTDYSVLNALKTFRSFKPKDMSKGRFIVLNVWRNISDTQVIEQDHLAVCDANSVHGPDDYLVYDYIASGFTSESYYLNAANHSKYGWYYFPKMTKNEAIIFKQYDSDVSMNARYCFHTAIHDNKAPSKAPARQSIEVRVIAFFPNHSPNTIVEMEDIDDLSVVQRGEKKVFESVSVGATWPNQYRKPWIKKVREEPPEACIKELIEGLIISKQGVFRDMSKEDVESVTKACIERKDEFKKICLEQFVEE